MKKVSIVIPVYNEEKYIANCIESVIGQTYRNIEIIIVNDGSTDQTYSICKEIAEQDIRINLIDIENSGVSTARNIGIENSTGDYITFVDSDDWIEPNMIELAVNKIQSENADVCMWSYFKNFVDKELSLPLLYDDDKIFINDKDLLFFKSINSSYKQSPKMHSVSAGTTWCKLYRKSLLVEHNIRFNPILTRAQDTVFSMNAFYHANKIVYFNKSLYHYRVTNTQISSGNRYIEDTITPFNELLREFRLFSDKVNDNEEFRSVFYKRTISVLLWHLNHKYFHKNYNTSIFIKRKKVLELINTEPYLSALKSVNLKQLPRKKKLLTMLFRKRLIITFYYIVKVNELLKNK